MKYNIENIDSSKGFIFFWGHSCKENVINKSCLSQWYKSDFIIDDVKYCCMEQYMMAEKAKLFNDSETLNLIMDETDQKTIKDLGRMVKNFNSNIWDENKYNIVLKGNFAKFSQNNNLKEFLLSTNDSIIVEASPYDKVWGIGMKQDDKNILDVSKWKGENLLGFALMEVRDMLR